ncbi:gluconate 2-dehydrogenase subunit 3 family protein [Frondihabitans australicus]|uniref:Gluconate 2-dehydrogenase subunit 3-like protein n=1 Tax=Frondihabitans australicus TaxID=386892 RepID=A0A495IFS9_9MICO|nr:gluconate 2-dehydrogenase subunit 3 family protein [Frondihabitans australicus]RKR74857.1 gluconate 2-dehydrogenase subunit 3-like protein [Frondihabitans australicus]
MSRSTGTTLPLPPEEGGHRFPGFDVLRQTSHWDDATRAAVTDRLHDLPPIRFFTPAEEAAATVVLDQLMNQRPAPGEPRIELTRMVDSRLAEDETDGWHYDDMPDDGTAWQRSLAALDDDAQAVHGAAVAQLDWETQTVLLASIKDSTDEHWHDLPRKRVWDLWSRYAATAFYSHPYAWNEIGFSGPAYPRGYKNPGVDRLEPFEVHDVRQDDDPVAGRAGAKDRS